jgi:UDP-galactopyranose mutase
LQFLGRRPIYISRDDRYFQDKYQGIPIEGYTGLVLKMLDHPNIEIKFSTVFSKEMEYERLFYSGPIDEFFEYRVAISQNKARFFGISIF